ncbi:MAG: rhodanese-like domain-containing protein [Phycisphaerales bacterium]|nr:MAG: rhodanese-like domain-containing protein [Phycisphaerales bacterium]
MGWEVLTIIVVLVLSGLAVKLYVSRGPKISQEQLLERMDQKAGIWIIDVRTLREFNSGHIPGAINISHQEISANLDKLKPYMNEDVVVYCELGVRANGPANSSKVRVFPRPSSHR